MPPADDPPPRRRRPDLADRRRSLGYTQESLAEAIGVASDTIAGWERGSRTPQPRYRPRLAHVLHLTVSEVDRMIDPDQARLVLNGHRVPKWLTHYESLVHAAGWLGEVERAVVPGLLQTKSYAAAVERTSRLRLTEQQVMERVDLRIARQAALYRAADPLQLVAVIHEGVLRDPVGGSRVMADQLDRFVEAAARPNIDVRVLPADGRAADVNASFDLLTRPGDEEPFMVVTFDPGGARYSEGDSIASFVATFNYVLTSLALSPAESVSRIMQIRETFQ